MAKTDDDLLGDIGFFVTVDLEYPEHLHEYFKDYPPAPVRRSVKLEETSPYYHDLCDRLSLNHDAKTEKLILDLHPKKEYLVHLRLLLLFLSLGVVVTKIHKS